MNAIGSDNPVIEIYHLNHWFGSGEAKTHTLFDNDLLVRRGEVVYLNGPSGSGKTTLLTLIGTLRSVQDGSLKVLGHECRGLGALEAKQLRKQIGFIFQAHNLFDSLTAFQNVRMAADLVGMPRSESTPKIQAMLSQLGLSDRMNYKPRSLSGGQKQRVAIARGLIHSPKIVLADEPTAALDEASGRDVVTLFREMADRDGCTFIIVTHDNRILDAADRIIKMVGGRIKTDSDLKHLEAICEFLRRSETFGDLTPRTLAEVSHDVTVREFATGDKIVVQGETGSEFFMIARGRVEVRKIHDGTDTIVNQLRTGDHFGEVSLLELKPRNATVVASEPTTCYVLDRETFRAVMDASDSFAAELRKAVFERV